MKPLILLLVSVWCFASFAKDIEKTFGVIEIHKDVGECEEVKELFSVGQKIKKYKLKYKTTKKSIIIVKQDPGYLSTKFLPQFKVTAENEEIIFDEGITENNKAACDDTKKLLSEEFRNQSAKTNQNCHDENSPQANNTVDRNNLKDLNDIRNRVIKKGSAVAPQ